MKKENISIFKSVYIYFKQKWVDFIQNLDNESRAVNIHPNHHFYFLCNENTELVHSTNTPHLLILCLKSEIHPKLEKGQLLQFESKINLLSLVTTSKQSLHSVATSSKEAKILPFPKSSILNPKFQR